MLEISDDHVCRVLPGPLPYLICLLNGSMICCRSSVIRVQLFWNHRFFPVITKKISDNSSYLLRDTRPPPPESRITENTQNIKINSSYRCCKCCFCLYSRALVMANKKLLYFIFCGILSPNPLIPRKTPTQKK